MKIYSRQHWESCKSKGLNLNKLALKSDETLMYNQIHFHWTKRSKFFILSKAKILNLQDYNNRKITAAASYILSSRWWQSWSPIMVLLDALWYSRELQNHADVHSPQAVKHLIHEIDRHKESIILKMLVHIQRKLVRQNSIRGWVSKAIKKAKEI